MNNQLSTAWDNFLSVVSSILPSSRDYNMWFKPIQPISYVDNTLTLRLPSAAYYEHLEGPYLKALREAMLKAFGNKVVIEYQILTDATNDLSRKGHSAIATNSTNAIPAPEIRSGSTIITNNGFNTHLDNRMRLDNFYQSVCNRMVLNCALSIIEKPGANTFNPLFIFGASGVGKTHIMHAIGNEIMRRTPNKRVIYVPTQIFKLQYVDAAIRRKHPEEFIHFYQNVDVLLLDDIQELKDAIATQSAFFQIFNNLKQLGKQIVISSDRPPVELQGLEERLFTRMSWGITAEIERPDVGLRKQVLESKLYESGMELPDDVFTFILKNARDNVRDIEGTLNSLLAHSIMSGKPITIELAEKVASQTVGISHLEVTMEDIIKSVTSYYNLTLDEVKGRSRKRPIVLARQIVMYLCKEHTDASLALIGSTLGGRDHSTVLYANKVIQNLIETDPKIFKQLQEIKSVLNL